jgi:hypothetical protein
MTVLFHPEFPNDVRKFTARYAEISTGLASRLRKEIDEAVIAHQGQTCSQHRGGAPVHAAGTRCAHGESPMWFV